MALRDDLIAAKALIDTPEKWSYYGAGTDTKFCAAVAVQKTTSRKAHRNCWRALCEQIPSDFKPFKRGSSAGVSLGDFNDHIDTTHADIMDLFDRAIAKAGETSNG